MKKYVLNCLQTNCIQVSPEHGESAVASFKIIFKPEEGIPLVKTMAPKAAYKRNNTASEPRTDQEPDMIKYDLEASTDGKLFLPVNTTTVTIARNTYNTYSWLDVNAVQGKNYYRVKSHDNAGRIEYSSVVEVAV